MSDASNVQTVTLSGKRYVIVPEAEYRKLQAATQWPIMPAPDAEGNYPAVEAIRASLARKLIRDRVSAGLSQQELGEMAGVRIETLSRIENGKHTPNVATIEKIDRALKRAFAGNKRSK